MCTCVEASADLPEERGEDACLCRFRGCLRCDGGDHMCVCVEAFADPALMLGGGTHVCISWRRYFSTRSEKRQTRDSQRQEAVCLESWV